MGAFFSSLRWLVFLLLVWLAAIAPRWVLPAIAVFAPSGLERTEMVVTSVSWEGEEGNRSRCAIGGDITLWDGEVISREIEVDEATADATSTGQTVAVVVNSWPGSAWFDGSLRRAALANDGVDPKSGLVAALRGPALGVALWAVFATTMLLLGVLRSATDAAVRSGDVLELDLSPSAGGCGSAVVAVGLALAVSVLAGWGGVPWAPVVLLLLGVLGWHRGALRVDRRAGTMVKITEIGPVRRTGAPKPLGTPTQVMVKTKKVGNATHYVLSLATNEGPHELGTFANYSTLDEDAKKLARYLGVGTSIAKSSDGPVADDQGEPDHEEPDYDEDEHETYQGGHDTSSEPARGGAIDWTTGRVASPASAAAPMVSEAPPQVQVLGGEPAIPRFAIFGCGCLIVLAGLGLAVVGLGTSSLATKGLEPGLANVPLVRELAAKALAGRDDEASQLAVLQFVHTADPSDPAWRPAVDALAAAHTIELPDSPFAATLLEPIDAAIAAKFGRVIDQPAGVFSWWGVSPGYVETVERIAGTDPQVAVDAWASLGPPNPATFEEAIAALGPALADRRPIHFAVLVADGGVLGRGEFYPGEVAVASTVGDAIAARLGLYGAWDQLASGDPLEAWRSAAAMRGYPAVWPEVGANN